MRRPGIRAGPSLERVEAHVATKTLPIAVDCAHRFGAGQDLERLCNGFHPLTGDHESNRLVTALDPDWHARLGVLDQPGKLRLGLGDRVHIFHDWDTYS